MTGRIAVIALAVSLLAAPAYAAQARKKAPEPPPPPPQFRVDVATRTMAVTRLALSFPETSKIGEAGMDLIGCSSKVPIYASNAFSAVPKDDYAKVFAAELAAAGYKMPSSQTDLFASGDASAPELQIGAAVISLSENGCPGTRVFTDYLDLEAVMKVEWQVFDPLEKKLLFRATNEGSAKLRRETSGEVVMAGLRGRVYASMAPDAARDAFQQAAKAILADPKFVEAVRDPKGGAPADPGALFPEAQNAAPAAPPQIIRVPLATKPFKDQVTQLRDQVVTVLTPSGQGSGFYIADGLLLTNHHVIAGHTRVRLRFYGGREIEAEVVASNARRDIALLKSASAGVTGLPLRLEPPELTATVFVIGTPARTSNEGSVIAGIVSAFREEKSGPFIQSDVAVTHGNSGGPMFDDKGNVIGLTDLGDKEAAAVNLFIPIADALKVLDIKFAP